MPGFVEAVRLKENMTQATVAWILLHTAFFMLNEFVGHWLVTVSRIEPANSRAMTDSGLRPVSE